MFHFAYILTAGESVVCFGTDSVGRPDATAVAELLMRKHAATHFWDHIDHQFCPTAEEAAALEAWMRAEYALRCEEVAENAADPDSQAGTL